MSKLKLIIKRLAQVGLVSVGVCHYAQATPTPGCTPGLSPTAAVSSAGNNVYCVTDYGNSDTWYPGPAPGGYHAELDYLSGDDSPFLSFNGIGQYNNGTNFLGHTMDAGTLSPSYSTGSNWQVVKPVAIDGQPTVSSTISLALGTDENLILEISTTSNADGSVVQHFTLTNNSTQALTDLTFGDYFNSHPNGSAGGENLGTTQYDGKGSIVTTGDKTQSSFLADSSMFLTLNASKVLPTAWDVINCTGSGNSPPCLAAINAVNALTFGNNNGPLTGDVVGILAYNLGTLTPGNSISFDIDKNTIPEPGSLSLMLFAIPMLRLFAKVS